LSDKKKYELRLYYSVINGGDGSAYPRFVESAKLATWLQENDYFDEGFGEDCSGSITLRSDSPITCDTAMDTIEDAIEEYKDCGDERKIKELHQMRDDINRGK
jgi:hypothetical protein